VEVVILHSEQDEKGTEKAWVFDEENGRLSGKMTGRTKTGSQRQTSGSKDNRNWSYETLYPAGIPGIPSSNL
jgi:hypothetical protein